MAIDPSVEKCSVTALNDEPGRSVQGVDRPCWVNTPLKAVGGVGREIEGSTGPADTDRIEISAFQ